MIKDYFWGKIEDIDMEDMWFQQDIMQHNTLHVFREQFKGRIISQHSDVN